MKPNCSWLIPTAYYKRERLTRIVFMLPNAPIRIPLNSLPTYRELKYDISTRSRKNCNNLVISL